MIEWVVCMFSMFKSDHKRQPSTAIRIGSTVLPDRIGPERHTKKAKPETQQRETQPLEPKHLRYVPSKKSSAPNAALQISVR